MAAATGGRAKLDPTTAEPAPPCVLVVFGATGDLTSRKILPAVYNLRRSGLLPAETTVLGFSRRPLRESVIEAWLAADPHGSPPWQDAYLERVSTQVDADSREDR